MKPYEKLRGFQTGEFYCLEPENRLKVKICRVNSDEMEVKIGVSGAPSFIVQKESAQVLSDFFADVAKSLS